MARRCSGSTTSPAIAALARSPAHAATLDALVARVGVRR
jgi:hypothetical protein